MDSGWTLESIDNMDIIHYFELLAYRVKPKEAPMVYIDHIF
ncbi:hypothetical protein ACVNS2_08040 [Paenibacillus caseinilyticus]|uniref:Uncharacterized protein n=1 Tax=Paenibacillus mucilaginosus K02 TaxID=997761 RepID=R9UMX5_9BACL|nr:hypothetical protein [Paenibacillus mucilaginosus]AGN70603.1 hypothetical protein B2K_38770 [Paenibacillus mucilaginosus K02]